jgi:hypothetical protein
MISRDVDITLYAAKLQPDGSYIDAAGGITWFNAIGERHSEDGPAIITYRGKASWYINGINYSFNEWCMRVNKSDEEAMLLRLQYDCS